jgi:hypothetical protein
MLRITSTHRGQATTPFKLEGKLLGSGIGELASACNTSRVSPDCVRLDLHGLTFVDAEGARFLASLIRDGARVIACSGFVAEILHLEGP